MRNFHTKKLLALLFAVMLLCFSLVSVSAAVSTEYLYDYEWILSDSEASALMSKLENMSYRHECNVAVVTSEDFDGRSIEAFSKDFAEAIEDNGSYTGTILMTVSETQREYYVYTTKGVGGVFTSSVREDICDNFLSYLQNGDYYGAMNSFADDCDSYLSNFTADDTSKEPTTFLDILFYIFVALVVGFLIALIAVLAMKGQLKSVRFQSQANNYIKEGTFRLTESTDTFLYRTVTRTARPKENSSSGADRSGSAGGTGGKF